MGRQRELQAPESTGSFVAEIDAILRDSSKAGELQRLLSRYPVPGWLENKHREFFKEPLARTFLREFTDYLVNAARDASTRTHAKAGVSEAIRLVAVIESFYLEAGAVRDSRTGVGTNEDGSPKIIVMAKQGSAYKPVLPVQPYQRFREDLGLDAFRVSRRIRPPPQDPNAFESIETVDKGIEYLVTGHR